MELLRLTAYRCITAAFAVRNDSLVNRRMEIQMTSAEILDALATAAAHVRDGFEPDPGTYDLDDVQPIHLSVALGEWRRLDWALRRLDAAGDRCTEEK